MIGGIKFQNPGDLLVMALPVEVLVLAKKTAWNFFMTRCKIKAGPSLRDCFTKLHGSTAAMKKEVKDPSFQKKILSLGDSYGCNQLSFAILFYRAVLFSEYITKPKFEVKTNQTTTGIQFVKASTNLLVDLMKVVNKYQ